MEDVVNAGRRMSGRTRRTRLVLGSRRAVAAVAAVLTVAMPAGLLSVPPALADPPNSHRPKVGNHEKPVPGHDLKVRPRKIDPVEGGPAARAAWPQAGTAEVAVPSGTKTAGVRAGKLPVQVLPPAEQPRSARTVPAAGRVRVQVLDRQTSHGLGVDGLALTVARTDAGTPGRVRVRLDYSTFAQAFGGAYGARLRLLQLPQCALSTLDKQECRTPKPVTARNDTAAKTLTADVEAVPSAVSGSPAVASGQNATLLVAAADSGSSQGDYKATSLEASATWGAGGNSGDFGWSYPMRVPPVPGGLTPKVQLTYSSGSVDGKTANTNGQPSWAGEGFDLWPGFIERRYKSCEDDDAPKDEFGNSPGDQCWGYDNATVTWNGKGGELIKAADGSWRMKNDDGTKFEKLTSSATGNGDDNGEYWKVTTTDGTQYFFGLNRLPNWTSGKPETNSTWTAPVFGDDSGEPCHDSTFASSWCQQAYRWNLDYVVDPSGNAITYTYGQETNHYGRNIEPEDETPYVRGGYLKTIFYGLRKDALFAKAPAQVSFATSERCIPDDDFDCDPAKIGDKPDHWWDVPWDLNCNSGQQCKDTHGSLSPTFWSRKRLTKVTTQILKPDGSDYRPVDSWSMDHQWGLADVERDLLLKEITHTGHAATDGGGAVSLPKVTFNHVQLPNRLDRTGDDILPYIRYRLGAIYDESGSQIDIAYSEPDCSLSDLPTPETNTTRCMPVIWTPPGREDPITDWFHKYVVTSVIQTDRTGLAPDMGTKYEYVGDAAWHYDNDDGLTREKEKTWSQWRGYGQVRTFTGDPAAPATRLDTLYLRGMDGDRKNKDGGTKSVTVADGEGGTHTDHDALAGFSLKTAQYTKPDGSVHAKTVNAPWRVQTASRTRPWGTTTANVVAVGSTRTWTAKDGGGWTETRTDNTYTASGPGIGRITAVNDLGDTGTSSDDKCTRTDYADNTDAWMVSFPSKVETVSVSCATTPNRPAKVISDTRTYYDNGGFGAAPSKGDITKAEKLADYEGTTPKYVTQATNVYDSFGRVTEVKDALGAATTTVYTDTHGLTTDKRITTPPAKPGEAGTALTTTEELDPAFGQPVRTTDANGLNTDLVYDGLGRLRKVWLPDRSKANNQNPNREFEYRVAEGQIAAITDKSLTATGGQRVEKVELLDGWLRSRQIQVPGPTGRLVSDTFYDDRGQVIKAYAAYPASGAPEPALFGVGTPGDVETQTRTEYDGLGRKTVEKLTTGNGSQPDQELWRTTYSYGGGNRVSVTPPAGGTPTAEITNARGQVTERRQYKAATPSGEFDATNYTYTPAGEIASITDPSGNTFTTTYDLRGRKTQTTDPDKGTSTFTYDDLDRLTSTTDARGKKVFTEYDGLGRKTATHDGAADGPLLTSFTYDTVTRGKGALATASRHADDAEYTSQIRQYDTLGRPEAITITIPSQQGALAGAYTFSSKYNLDGTVQSNSLPAKGGLPVETLVNSYDTWLRPTRMATTGTTYVADTVYTPTGKPSIVELGTTPKRAWQTFTYQHGTQRLDTAKTLREGIDGNDRNATYQYTDAGSVTSITDNSRDGIDNQCFAYDHLQRLTEAWTQGTADACASEPTSSVIGGPAPYWQSFGYDKAGNRTNETRHGIGGAADTVRTYTYAPTGQGNRLTQVTQTGPAGNRTDIYGYDATGNTITRAVDSGTPGTGQTLEWDTEGELAKVTENGNDETFIYDATGNRLIRKDPTGATLYLPGGTELRALNGATTPTGTRYYDFAGQTVAMRTSDGTLTYLTGDHQGTDQIAINAATQASTIRRFTPFGGIRGMDDDATWPGDKGFLGGTQDPTGLTHLGAREYDPDTGRFISVDPVMDQADPQQMNGYTYANNNPVTHADPDGQCPPDICGAGVINVGHSKPAKTGGCGHDICGSPKNTANIVDSYLRPRRTKIGATVINAPTAAAYRAAFLSALLLRDKSIYWVDRHDPLPTCTPGAAGAVNGACSPGDIDILTRFGDLVCKVGGFKCSHLSTRNYFLLGLSGFEPGMEGGVGHPGGLGGGGRSKSGKSQNLRSCSSFVPGTTVLMADGSRKPIEDVKVGDKVLATDPETGETRAQPVLGTITSKGDKNLVQITVDGDAPSFTGSTSNTAKPRDSKGGVVIATDHHPFWVAGDINQWVEAADLQPGMWLRTSAGTYVQITATQHWTTHHQRVHNLTIANTHTYYVLAGAPVLVHNDNGCGVARNEKGQFTSGENADAARGRQTHLNYRSALGAGYDFEVTLPSGLRPDAVDWKNRVVRELKSDARSSQATGRRQLQKYVAELEDITGQSWTGHLDTYKRFG
ncbi:RHS repeat-associated core domain-containing protein [Actinomadura madurae]|uniref:RHS repeat-associated core domain-containing protein n=1 Tax=Actinomadura madurae TaxID=1993 RepID=UPI001160B6B5|nr:RHS repeat-associated core domain-containing protein [Actinomadura madurae]